MQNNTAQQTQTVTSNANQQNPTTQPVTSQATQGGQQIFPQQQSNAAPVVETHPTITTPPPPPKKRSIFKTLFLLFFVLILVGGILVGFFAYAVANDLAEINNPEIESMIKNVFGKSANEEVQNETAKETTENNLVFYDLKITNESAEEIADFEILVASDSAFFRPKVFYIDFEYGFEDWIRYEDADLGLLETDLQAAFGEIDQNNLQFSFSENEFVTPEIPERFSSFETFKSVFANIPAAMEIIDEINNSPNLNDDMRRKHLLKITNAVYQYAAEHDGVIADEDGDENEQSFPTEPTCIGKAPQCWGLETAGLESGDTLIPTYMDEYVMDPVTGHVQDTGYMIYRDEETGRVIATAIGELEEEIRVER